MSVDEIIEKNKVKINALSVFALIFSLGFACGYYYLDAAKSEEVLTIQDKSADCEALFEQNTEFATADSALVDETASRALGTVLSSSDTKSDSDTQAINQQFAGSKNSTLYHTRNCQYVKRIKAENLVGFASAAEAETAGRKPHSCISK